MRQARREGGLGRNVHDWAALNGVDGTPERTAPLWAFPGGLKVLDLPTAQAFRRMLACFIHWLSARGGLANDAEVRRRELLNRLSEPAVDASAIIAALDDELRTGIDGDEEAAALLAQLRPARAGGDP